MAFRETSFAYFNLAVFYLVFDVKGIFFMRNFPARHVIEKQKDIAACVSLLKESDNIINIQVYFIFVFYF